MAYKPNEALTTARPTSTSFLGRQRFGGIQQQTPYSKGWRKVSLGGFPGALDKSTKKFTHQNLPWADSLINAASVSP